MRHINGIEIAIILLKLKNVNLCAWRHGELKLFAVEEEICDVCVF
jgi:hypothetical protein